MGYKGLPKVWVKRVSTVFFIQLPLHSGMGDIDERLTEGDQIHKCRTLLTYLFIRTSERKAELFSTTTFPSQSHNAFGPAI